MILQFAYKQEGFAIFNHHTPMPASIWFYHLLRFWRVWRNGERCWRRQREGTAHGGGRLCSQLPQCSVVVINHCHWHLCHWHYHRKHEKEPPESNNGSWRRSSLSFLSSCSPFHHHSPKWHHGYHHHIMIICVFRWFKSKNLRSSLITGQLCCRHQESEPADSNNGSWRRFSTHLNLSQMSQHKYYHAQHIISYHIYISQNYHIFWPTRGAKSAEQKNQRLTERWQLP